MKTEEAGSSETLVSICQSARLHGRTWQNTVTLLQCFPNGVPRNPTVGQNIIRGSMRNHGINIQLF
jgi:hypothetical protein